MSEVVKTIRVMDMMRDLLPSYAPSEETKELVREAKAKIIPLASPAASGKNKLIDLLNVEFEKRGISRSTIVSHASGTRDPRTDKKAIETLRTEVEAGIPEAIRLWEITQQGQELFAEFHGITYHFVDDIDFLEMMLSGGFVECAEVQPNNFRGVSAAALKKAADEADVVMAEINFEGMDSVGLDPYFVICEDFMFWLSLLCGREASPDYFPNGTKDLSVVDFEEALNMIKFAELDGQNQFLRLKDDTLNRLFNGVREICHGLSMPNYKFVLNTRAGLDDLANHIIDRGGEQPGARQAAEKLVAGALDLACYLFENRYLTDDQYDLLKEIYVKYGKQISEITTPTIAA